MVNLEMPSFSLRAKVMLLFLVLALAPLAGIGWFSIKTTEHLVVSMMIRQLENVAADKVAILERWLDERRADLMVMAGTSLVKSMDPEQMAPYLDLIREKYGVYRELAVVSATDGLVFRSRSDPPPAGKRQKEDYVVRGSLYISDITYEPEEMESAFRIAAPVYNDDGTIAGTIYGSVGTSKIIVFILNVSLGETGESYLVDQEGRFLAHKEPRRILTENISRSESFKNIFEQRDRKKAYLDYRGIAVFGTFRKVSGTDWHVVVEQDRDEAFESADTLKRIIYLTLLLCIASALAMTWIISWHIVSPIRALSRYSEVIADAQFDKPLHALARTDEIGMLFQSFEKMSRKLKERQNRLEHTVGLREAELKETDMVLQKTRLVAERSEKFAAMGRMGAAVAHEIRTPLTSLKLFLESVEAEIGVSEEYAADFSMAMQQITRIETTINRFLDFIRPKDPVFQEIDVAALLAEVISIVRPLVNRHECAMEARINDLLPAITGDRKLLADALINLFVNAVEAMPEHGVLTVAACVNQFEDADGRVKIPCVRIEIGDTGCGIADDQLEFLFEPFYTTKASGTGLGLPLAVTTIRHHGGVIRVSSTLGQGTTFSIFLPFSNSPDLASAAIGMAS
jgi:two-component system, NtrC family, sensor kinase